MLEGKVIETIVRRKLSEVVDEAQKSADLLSPNCERDDAQRIKNALEFLGNAQKAMLEGFSAILEGNPRPAWGKTEEARGSATGSSEGSSQTSDQRRFDPMDILSEGLKRFDAETVGKGLDVLQGFVRMVDDVKRKGRRG